MKTIFMTLLIACTLLNTTNAAPKFSEKEFYESAEIEKINKMIKVIRPDIKDLKRSKVSRLLFNTSKKYQVDPKIMIAIIDTESDFDNNKISTTGDLSMAQINTDIWNRELKRLKLSEIDSNRLKTDENYALNQMALILSILKNRHSQTDGIWYARYHSHTKKFKNVYFAKIDLRMRKIASIY